MITRASAPFIVRRRGMGQSTLATSAQLPAFCASVGADASAYPACATVSAADIAAAAANLPVGTGFALAPPVNKSGLTNSQLQSLVNQAAPPVYLSSYQAQPNQGTYSTQYFIDQTAASVANEVNANNARAYSQWQTDVQNWIQNGSPGTMPPPPTYQTFTQAWAPNNMGGTPSSITTAPAGTPIPAGTFLTGGQTTSSGSIAYPGVNVSSPAPPVSSISSPKPAPVIQSNAPNASVVGGGSAQSNATQPTAAAPTGILQTLQNFVTAPTAAVQSSGLSPWVWIAGAAGIGLLFLMPKGK